MRQRGWMVVVGLVILGGLLPSRASAQWIVHDPIHYA